VGNAYCARAQACAPAYVQLQWGDVATCSSKLGAELAGTLAATGTGDTPSQLESCVQALPGISCDDLLGRNVPAPCRAVAGSLANGAACGDDSQCSGGHCKIASGQTCGVCTTFAAAGSSCTVDGDCDYGLKCLGNAGAPSTCTAFVASGAMCDATHPCLPTLVCKGGACATPGAAGVSCNPKVGDTCDNLHGVFCDTQSSTCKAIGFAKAGAACGLVSGTLTLCLSDGGSTATAACKGLAAPTYMGTCQAPAADGATCDATNGPFCVSPSVCVNGACKIDDPSGCH
jgi:hypothetical protein